MSDRGAYVYVYIYIYISYLATYVSPMYTKLRVSNTGERMVESGCTRGADRIGVNTIYPCLSDLSRVSSTSSRFSSLCLSVFLLSFHSLAQYLCPLRRQRGQHTQPP